MNKSGKIQLNDRSKYFGNNRYNTKCTNNYNNMNGEVLVIIK